MKLFSELRRRNVLRMAVLYAVAAWLIMQVAEVIIGLANLPSWIGPTILALLAIGFPIALIFSWFYELTPEGVSLEKDIAASESITHVTGRRMDFLVISMLLAAVLLFAYDKWWTGPPPEKSIAVLAFENMSGDPEQEYFSDGISEELLNVLAKLPGLRVAARTSSFQFKGQNEDIARIADALNVAHILEGSVRRSGNKIRITAQLIKANDGFHLWSETYDREFGDIFSVQDEIAAAISDALKVKLALVEGEAMSPTVIRAANTDAYDAYLQGRELFRRRGTERVEDAIRHLERSLRLDNNFAPAHAQLAIATAMLGNYGVMTMEEVRRTAIPHLDRAQELEPDLAEAHAGRALLAGLEGDPESRIEYARKALASNPSYVDAMNWLYIALLDLGHYEEAEATVKQMLVTDPLSLIGRWEYAEWLAVSGRFEEAHAMADQLLEQHLGFGIQVHVETSLLHEGKIAEGLSWGLKYGSPYAYAMFAFMMVGEYDEARRLYKRRLHWVDHFEGRVDEAIRTTQELMREDPDDKPVIRDTAYFLYYAGRIDEALPLYERLLDFVPEGRPIASQHPLEDTMHLALARRKAGDEDGAQAAAQIVRKDHAARRAAGRRTMDQDMAEAMIAAFDNNREGAIAALKSAIQRGLKYRQFFDNPIFEDLRDEPRFVALQKELDAILAVEHEKVLQLICFNNPVPDDWQPLPETCEGAIESQP